MTRIMGADFGSQFVDGRLGGRQDHLLFAVFEQITPKQHEVMQLVSENRTSKEIAWQLGISESGVNQRIESVRARTGYLPRAELARAYRQYAAQDDTPCNPLTSQIPQVLEAPALGHFASRDGGAEILALADAMDFTAHAPWRHADYQRIVPEVLDGANAGLNRVAAMIAIAVGMLALAMVGLGVAQALTTMF